MRFGQCHSLTALLGANDKLSCCWSGALTLINSAARVALSPSFPLTLSVVPLRVGMGTAECGARAGACPALALVDKVPQNFAANAKKEPQADTRLGFYSVASVQGFWSDGVRVSGDGKMPPGRPCDAQIERRPR
jgi:hypothetical protein